jgi:hypothetical protein
VSTHVRRHLRRWPAGRWFVCGGLVVGLFFGVQQAATGSSLYEAFLKGVAAAAAVMLLAGIAQRLFEGDKVQSAQLPGGAGAAFETAEAAAKTREGVEQLNTRVTHQAEQMITMQAQLDRRVTDLESAAFKERPARGEN